MIKFKMASFQRSRFLQVFVVYLFSMLTLSGQGSFRSGTIIVNDSTKMNGKISPALSDGIITSCLFRAGNEGNTVTFTPDDLQGWHLEGGRQFISGSYISPETSEMFLEILFDGISDLFYYNDLSAEHYLIRDRNGRLFTLKSYSKKGKSSIPDEETDLSGIRAVLRICMADAPALAERINMIEPERETLTDLMHDYHVLITQSESDIAYELPPPRTGWGTGLFIRYSSDMLHAGEEGDLSGISFDPANFPGIGLFVTTSFPRITRNLWATLNLSLAERYAYGFYASDEAGPSLTLYEELHLHQLFLSGELLFGYSVGTRRLRPSFFTGLSGQFIISDDSRIDYDLAGDDLIVSESLPYNPDGNIRFGFTLGTGIEYQLSPALSLFMNAGYTRFSGDDEISSIDSFAVTAGITF
jgi:hypothetical protein